jgi:ectoine hydroxylase-related dioxygenase (phytanoyl-CoA dioxygenase family)
MSNRVYGLMAKGKEFVELALQPLALGYAEAHLGASCLLSAMLAIRLHPGESVQPWHTDDGHIEIPFPRPAYGISAFWALDATTEQNGATEVIPGSHAWETPHRNLCGYISDDVLKNKSEVNNNVDPGAHPDSVQALLGPGSLMLSKGTLWHRGGANKSTNTRTIITPQYCPGWVRQLENQLLAVPREVAKQLPQRAQELLGYSIHPPFMGYVNGVHPNKQL